MFTLRVYWDAWSKGKRNKESNQRSVSSIEELVVDAVAELQVGDWRQRTVHWAPLVLGLADRFCTGTRRQRRLLETDQRTVREVQTDFVHSHS